MNGKELRSFSHFQVFDPDRIPDLTRKLEN